MKTARISRAILALLLLSACTPDMGGPGFSLSSFGDSGAAAPASDPAAATVTKASNMRASPSREGSVIAILPAGSKVSVVGSQKGWTQVRCAASGKTGWISSELVSRSAPQQAASRNVNLRGKVRSSVVVTNRPGGSRVGDLRGGDAIGIVAEQGDWYQIDCGSRIAANECWAPKDKFYTETPVTTTSGAGSGRGVEKPAKAAATPDFNPFAALFGGTASPQKQDDARTAGTADDGLAFGSLFSAFTEDDSAPQTFSDQSDSFIRNMNIGTVNLLKALANMQAATGNKELAEQIMAQAASLKRGGETGTATSEDYKKAFAVIDQSAISREDLARVPAEQGGVQMVNSWIRVGLAVNADIKAFNMAQKMFKKGPNLAEMLMNADKLGTVLDLGLTGLPSHIEKAGTWMSMLGDYMQENKIPQPSDDQKKRALVQDGTVTSDEADDLFGDA